MSIRIKPMAGSGGQTGGLVWRYRDPLNYYVVRANAADKTIAVFRVQNGQSTAIANPARLEVGANAWSILKISARGTKFQVYMDHRRVLEGQDAAFLGPGKVGLCTVDESEVYFDDFRVNPQIALHQPPVHFDGRRHGDRHSVFRAGLELPAFHRFDGLFVEAQAQRAPDREILRRAVRVDLRDQQDRPLELRGARLGRVLRLRLEEQRGRRHAIADAVNARSDGELARAARQVAPGILHLRGFVEPLHLAAQQAGIVDRGPARCRIRTLIDFW